MPLLCLLLLPQSQSLPPLTISPLLFLRRWPLEGIFPNHMPPLSLTPVTTLLTDPPPPIRLCCTRSWKGLRLPKRNPRSLVSGDKGLEPLPQLLPPALSPALEMLWNRSSSPVPVPLPLWRPLPQSVRSRLSPISPLPRNLSLPLFQIAIPTLPGILPLMWTTP